MGTWRNREQALRNYNPEREKKLQRVEDEDARFMESLGYSYPYKAPPKRFSKKIDESKLVCIADPHEPYSHPSVWRDVLDKHHDAYHIHINGDFFDFYSQSHFRKIEGDESFNLELKKGFDRLQWLSSHFHRVTLILGNHDNRAEKRISDQLDADKLWLVKRDIVQYCASFFDNVEVVGQRIDSNGRSVDVSFIWQWKDVIFTHIERSQKQSSALLSGINESLGYWSGYLKLKPYSFIIQGHNHRADVLDLGDKTLMLAPMAADILGKGLRYVLQPGLRGQPPTVGYIVLHNRDGKTVYNESRIYKAA